jgi:hypothetical protein
MPFQFRRAIRENVGLWINLVGGTGSGKTFTGFRLASGMSGGKPFAVLDTENRRALHYADQFKFDHAELRPPFRPSAYAEAVVAADKAGYAVIMIDSGSHVWAGDGGVLDWQEEELDRMAGTDWKKRESCKMAAWIKPKMAHKQMVQKLLQVKAHIIFCLRAEPKIEMVKGKDAKMEVQAKHSLTGLDGWIPVCEKNLPFEATSSFLLMAANPGIPLPIKLQNQHRAMFPLDKEITEESGRLIAAWATGANQPSIAAPEKAPASSGISPPDAQAGAALGPQTAAAQGNGSTGGDAGPESPPAPAAVPTDAELVSDIEKCVKRKNFDSAFDLARGIQDHDLHLKTVERIDKALAFVTAHTAAK